MNLKSIIPWKKEEEERPLAVTARRSDGDPFALLQRRMNSLFNDFLGSSSGLWGGFDGDLTPRIDVSETDNEVRVSAELPGLDEKEVDVTLSENMLTIKGEKKEEREEERGDYWHSECRYGYFERAVRLPNGIDADKAKAKFRKGVLKVAIPKKPEAQSTRRKVEILTE